MSSLIIKDEDNCTKISHHEESNQAGGLRDSATSYRSYKKDDETEPRVKFQAKKKRGGAQVQSWRNFGNQSYARTARKFDKE